MAIANSKPVPLIPSGVVDAVDMSNAAPGAMSSLQNLVPDPSTKGIYVPRPAAIKKTSFGGFTTPGFVSCLFVVGDLAYGMIASGKNAGKDEPFIYDLNAAAFIAITGVTNAKSPTSPATTGTWVPPTMAVVGTKVIVTHPGFDGITYFIGWLDISTPASPVWDAGNTTTNALPARPAAVFSFNSRAWYAVNNTVWWSATLTPLTITNATDFLTMGDTTPVVALSGMPLLNTQGGIVQSMFAFKNSTLFQVTGDITNSPTPLISQAIQAGVGTYAPLSITPTNEGLAFISTHGLRVITENGQVGPVIGGNGSGIAQPFINAAVPSRICAAHNVDTTRITTQNQFIPSVPVQDWWYNTDLESWSGSHTFPASLIQPWRDTFLMTPVGVTASLWQSDTLPQETSSYIENGNQLVLGYAMPTSTLTGTMNMNAVIETSIGIQFSEVGGTLNFTALDENGGILDVCSKTVTVSAAIWDVFTWGSGLWGGTVLDYQQLRVPWNVPIVFNQMIFAVNGDAVTGFKIGSLFMRYQVTGYTVMA